MIRFTARIASTWPGKPRASGDDPMHGSVYMEAGM